jgi:general stress protein YciG
MTVKRDEDNSMQHSADSANRSETQEHRQRGGSGRGWHGDPEGHAAAGRKGGQKVARNREHMAEIGRRGGEAVSRDRQHMAEIGRKGGQARGESPEERS